MNESGDDEFDGFHDEGNNSQRWCDLSESNILTHRLRGGADAVNCCFDFDSVAFMATFEEPETYKEAIRSREKLHWTNAMNEEFDSLKKKIKRGSRSICTPARRRLTIVGYSK